MAVPLVLELAGRPVLCVGAGPVAAAKVGPLLAEGAVVTVIAPDVHADLLDADVVEARPFAPGDVDRHPRPRLVVAATGVGPVDDVVAAEAEALGIWCLRTHGPSEVVVPSVVRRSRVTVAMTTGAPALTRRLRETVEAVVDERWTSAGDVLAGLRDDPEVRAALRVVPPDERRRRWRAAVDGVLAADPDVAQAVLRDRARTTLTGPTA